MNTVGQSQVINLAAILPMIRQSFDGSCREILGELLQNSQRAGAKNISITTPALPEGKGEGDAVYHLTFEDDGQGIAPDRWFEVVSIPRSYWERREAQDQQPKGLGLSSLLAHKGVKGVIFVSGDYSYHVVTEQVWSQNGLAYLSEWASRLQTGSLGQSGLCLDIFCTAEFVRQVKALFAIPESRYAENLVRERASAVGQMPHNSYADFFASVTVDGVELGFVPSREAPVFKREYEGNEVQFYANGKSEVDFYGQLVPFSGKTLVPFRYVMRQGCPLNFLSPSRRGVIEDEASQKLANFVSERALAYGAEEIPQEGLGLAATLWRNATPEQRKKLSYVLAAGFPAHLSDWLYDNFAASIVVRRSAGGLFVADYLSVIIEGQETEDVRVASLGTFYDALRRAFGGSHNIWLVDGYCVNSVPYTQELVWEPGPACSDNNIFDGNIVSCELGRWGLRPYNPRGEDAPIVWHEFQPGDVVAVATEACEYSIFDASGYVGGVGNNTQKALEFLDEMSDLFFENSSSDADSDAFEASVSEMRRNAQPNTIGFGEHPALMQRFFVNHQAALVSAHYVTNNGRYVAVKVTNKDGETKTLTYQ